jgi:hypothetical protein
VPVIKRVICDRCTHAVHPGIVDGEIQTTAFLDGKLDKLLHAFEVGHIDDKGTSLSAVRSNCRCNRVSAIGIAIGNDDLGTLVSELPGNRRSNSGACARHDRDFSFKAKFHRSVHSDMLILLQNEYLMQGVSWMTKMHAIASCAACPPGKHIVPQKRMSRPKSARR